MNPFDALQDKDEIAVEKENKNEQLSDGRNKDGDNAINVNAKKKLLCSNN